MATKVVPEVKVGLCLRCKAPTLLSLWAGFHVCSEQCFRSLKRMRDLMEDPHWNCFLQGRKQGKQPSSQGQNGPAIHLAHVKPPEVEDGQIVPREGGRLIYIPLSSRGLTDSGVRIGPKYLVQDLRAKPKLERRPLVYRDVPTPDDFPECDFWLRAEVIACPDDYYDWEDLLSWQVCLSTEKSKAA